MLKNVLILTNNEQSLEQRNKQFEIYKKLIQENDIYDEIYFVDGGFDLQIYNLFSEKKKTKIFFVGDLDSANKFNIQSGLSFSGVHILNPIKDDTDFIYCLKLLKDTRNINLTIFNCIGGRFSMSYANLIAFRYLYNTLNVSFNSLKLKYFQDEKLNTGYIVYPHYVLNLSNEKDITLSDDLRINVFSLTDKTNHVVYENLYYKFDGTMQQDIPIGVSNKIIVNYNNKVHGDIKIINKDEGLLLVLLEK